MITHSSSMVSASTMTPFYPLSVENKEIDRRHGPTRARTSKKKEGNRSKGGKTAPVPFPMRLHNLLDDAETRGFQHIVAWQPDGQSFKVKDPVKIERVLDKYFKLTKYRSFLRQLQDYGFSRVSWGSETGLCSHPDIIRGQRQRCKFMYRKQANSGNSVNRMAANSYLPPITVSTYRVHSPQGPVLETAGSMSFNSMQFSPPVTDVSHGSFPNPGIQGLAMTGNIFRADVVQPDHHKAPELQDSAHELLLPTALDCNDIGCKSFLMEGLPEARRRVVEEAAFEGCRFFTL